MCYRQDGTCVRRYHVNFAVRQQIEPVTFFIFAFFLFVSDSLIYISLPFRWSVNNTEGGNKRHIPNFRGETSWKATTQKTEAIGRKCCNRHSGTPFYNVNCVRAGQRYLCEFLYQRQVITLDTLVAILLESVTTRTLRNEARLILRFCWTIRNTKRGCGQEGYFSLHLTSCSSQWNPAHQIWTVPKFRARQFVCNAFSLKCTFTLKITSVHWNIH